LLEIPVGRLDVKARSAKQKLDDILLAGGDHMMSLLVPVYKEMEVSWQLYRLRTYSKLPTEEFNFK
jgi:hypothetical protein